MDRQLEEYKITGKEAFAHYRKNAKKRDLTNTPREVYHTSIVNSFWEKVKDKMVENRGGVYIKGFGYFCVAMHPERMVAKTKLMRKSYINSHTKSYLYFPLFIADRKNWSFKTFTMDRFFKQSLRHSISKKLKTGFKYLNFFYEVRKTFSNIKK